MVIIGLSRSVSHKKEEKKRPVSVVGRTYLAVMFVSNSRNRHLYAQRHHGQSLIPLFYIDVWGSTHFIDQCYLIQCIAKCQ